MTNTIISANSIERRKALFEIRNTLFRRRHVLEKALLRRIGADQEEMRCELKQIETVLEQMRRGTYGKCPQTGSQISIDDLIVDPFLTIAE